MKILSSFWDLLGLCNIPLGFFKYVMEPKGFIIYINKGIACALNNFGHKQYPSNSLDQNNSITSVYITLKRVLLSFLGLNF